MTRFCLGLLILLLSVATPAFAGEDETRETPLEISAEDREIAELLELLELMELLSEMDDVAALEENG